MITIAKYTRLEDAQADAARLGKRDIAAAVVHGGDGYNIFVSHPVFELQVDPSDIQKFEELEQEILDEIKKERGAGESL